MLTDILAMKITLVIWISRSGSSDGVTALQMDIKIQGITEEIMHVALGQAREARLHILGEMNKVIERARDEVADTAPRPTFPYRSGQDS